MKGYKNEKAYNSYTLLVRGAIIVILLIVIYSIIAAIGRIDDQQKTIVKTEEQILADAVVANSEAETKAGIDTYGNSLELMKQEVIMGDENVMTVQELLELYDEVNH